MKTVMTSTGACKWTADMFPFLAQVLVSISNLYLTVGFYAGLNLVAWVMIFCFVRETKQLTLEELDRK